MWDLLFFKGTDHISHLTEVEFMHTVLVLFAQSFFLFHLITLEVKGILFVVLNVFRNYI